MKQPHKLFISLAVTLLCWAFYTWPLPEYVASGIPSSAFNIEKDQVRTLIQGDHLQLIYRLWLVAGYDVWRYAVAQKPL